MREVTPFFSPAEASGKIERSEEIQRFRTRLNGIVSAQLTPDNIDSYLDSAANQLITLVQDVLALYQADHPDSLLSGKAFEDTAFTEFGLEEIENVLTSIQRKQDQISEVQIWIQEHTSHASDVLVPPSGTKPQPKNGQDEFERRGTKSRLQTLLYILKTDGGTLEGISVARGEMSNEMMRKESYVSVIIPSLNRLVLVCDEEENASYFFDTEGLYNIAARGENSMVATMSKAELNDLINRHSGIGVRLVYTAARWVDDVRALLYEPIRLPAIRREGRRYLSTSDLDPWRGFWTDPKTGWHYSTRDKLAEKLSETYGKISVNNIDYFKKEGTLTPERVFTVGARSQEHPMYALEDIISKYREFLELPCAAADDNLEEAEWRGFYFDEETNIHFGNRTMIRKKLKITLDALKKKVTWSAVRNREMRAVSGEKCLGYAYEDIIDQSQMKDFLALPHVDIQGEWMHFYTDPYEGKHYGTIYALIRRIEKDHHIKLFHVDVTLNDVLQSKVAIDISDGSGNKNKGYCYEDVIKDLEAYLSKPRGMPHYDEGEGLFQPEGTDEQWGTLGALAKHLHVENTSLRYRVNQYLKAGNKLETIDMIAVGRETKAYRLSDIETLVKGLKRREHE